MIERHLDSRGATSADGKPGVESHPLSFTRSSMLLEAASRIGDRLVANAEWSAKRCNWSITTSDPADVWSRRAVRVHAGPWLYQGTVGIALFLSELHARTGGASLLSCIEGALENALDDLQDRPLSQVGFHTGFTGPAYVLIRHGIASGQGNFVERGQALLARLPFGAGFLGTTDVITGAAGAIPVLLAAAGWTGSSALRDSAFALGSSVVRAATRWPIGWSWPSTVTTNTHDLTGLAHGAAGFGHALIELYAASGDVTFMYAAEQAFTYEDRFFNEAAQNWPDFRNHTLAETLASDAGREEFVQQLRRGSSPPVGQSPSMTSWCHGAPGIGLARLRAFEVLGSERYRHMSRIAVATTEGDSRQIDNYSLCHGVFGNDATLMEASRVLGEPQWESQALERAESAVEQYELAGRPWPSGTLAAVPDPSLMLGDAGVGYHLLRLVDSRLPSILLPIVDYEPRTGEALQTAPLAKDYDAQYRREHVRVFFARTIKVVQRLANHTTITLPKGDNPVIAFADAIHSIRSSTLNEAELIVDASASELTRVDMTMSVNDTTDTLLDDLGRVPSAEVDWRTARLSLSRFSKLVTEVHDWDGWLQTTSASTPPPRRDHAICVLLHRRAGSVTIRKLNHLSSVVLSRVVHGVTLEQVVRGVIDSIDSAAPDSELERLIFKLITNAYDAGVIGVAPPNADSG